MVNFVCNFVQERSEYAKKSVSLLHFHPLVGYYLPHPPLYQPNPVAKIWYRLGTNRVTCCSRDRGN